MDSPRQLLATALLGRPVADYIRDYRDDGVSWRTITRNLHQDTGGKVDVTEQTLRAWVKP